MRCDEVQAYLAEHLTTLLAERLSGQVQSHIRDHMMSCADCCEKLEDFEEMQQVLRSIPVEPCDSEAMRATFDSLMVVRDAKVYPSQARRGWPGAWLVIVIAGFVAIVAAVFVTRRNHEVPVVTSSFPIVDSASIPPLPVHDTPLPVADPPGTVNGLVLMEDGSAISDSGIFGEIAIRSESDLGKVAIETVRVDSSGRFIRSLAAGRYRIRVSAFSQDYLIQSITAGTSDLSKEPIEVKADAAAAIEIRIARNHSNTGRVQGVVTRGAGVAQTGERVQLCCFGAGAAERKTAAIAPDGTFEFRGIPPGHYSAELWGNSKLAFANPAIDVSGNGVSGWVLNAVSPLVPIEVTLRLDTDGRLPYHPGTSIVFTGQDGKTRAAASGVVGNLFRVSLPSDGEYTVTVSNVAAGYAVQSVTDSSNADLLSGGRLTVSSDTTRPPSVTVTLTKN